MEAYTDFASVYDELMDNTPYGQWCDNIVKVLGEYGINDGLVLDLGCGTGSLTQLLAAKGYDMIGVDYSEEMLNIACQKREKSGCDILYLNQDMREFELYGTVRAIVSICDSINYLLEDEDVVTCFELVNNYLDPGGIFIFDLNTVYKYQEILGEQTIAEDREECSFIWDNFYDEEERINEYQLSLFIQNEQGTYNKYEELHLQKAYEQEEVVSFLYEAGFSSVRVLDAETMDEVKEDTQRLYYIAN